MQVNSFNKAESLLNQLQGSLEVSPSRHWMSHIVRYLKNTINYLSAKAESQELQEPAVKESKSQSLIKKVARATFEFLAEPKGVEIAKQLVQQTCKRFDEEADERHHLLLLREVQERLESNQIEEAIYLVQMVEKVETLDEAAEVLADELRRAALQVIEQNSVEQATFTRLWQICDSLNPQVKERARLYRFMVEQDPNFPKASCESDQKAKRHHFLLRMAKSLTTLEQKEFPGLKPLEGIAMIIEDLDAYLQRHSESLMAKTAKKMLLRCRSILLEGDMAERLSRDEKNPAYLDIYFSDIAKEIDSLKENERLILLGGSHDHAILHSVHPSSKGLTTYNSGLGVLKHRPVGKNRFQTHIITNISKKNFSKEFVKSLFSPKLIDVSSKTEEEKKQISIKQIEEIYQLLKQLTEKRPTRFVCLDDPRHAHRMQPHNTCLRNIYLMWLKEEILLEEYPAFKIPFSEKAVNATSDPELQLLGQEKLAHRQSKVPRN